MDVSERETHSDDSPHLAGISLGHCLVRHRVALLDRLREDPQDTIRALVAAYAEQGSRTPVAVNLLVWTFLTGPHHRVMRRLAGWALGGG